MHFLSNFRWSLLLILLYILGILKASLSRYPVSANVYYQPYQICDEDRKLSDLPVQLPLMDSYSLNAFRKSLLNIPSIKTDRYYRFHQTCNAVPKGLAAPFNVHKYHLLKIKSQHIKCPPVRERQQRECVRFVYNFSNV